MSLSPEGPLIKLRPGQPLTSLSLSFPFCMTAVVTQCLPAAFTGFHWGSHVSGVGSCLQWSRACCHCGHHQHPCDRPGHSRRAWPAGSVPALLLEAAGQHLLTKLGFLTLVGFKRPGLP